MHVCTQLYRHVVGVWATVLCVGAAHVHDTGPSSSSGAHYNIDIDMLYIGQDVIGTAKAYSLGAMK